MELYYSRIQKSVNNLRTVPKPNAERRNSTDPAIDNWKHELLRDGARPTYIALELDHQYDELHTYDGFYDDKYKSEDAVKSGDIYSLVYEAINT